MLTSTCTINNLSVWRVQCQTTCSKKVPEPNMESLEWEGIKVKSVQAGHFTPTSSSVEGNPGSRAQLRGCCLGKTGQCRPWSPANNPPPCRRLSCSTRCWRGSRDALYETPGDCHRCPGGSRRRSRGSWGSTPACLWPSPRAHRGSAARSGPQPGRRWGWCDSSLLPSGGKGRCGFGSVLLWSSSSGRLRHLGDSQPHPEGLGPSWGTPSPGRLSSRPPCSWWGSGAPPSSGKRRWQ